MRSRSETGEANPLLIRSSLLGLAVTTLACAADPSGPSLGNIHVAMVTSGAAPLSDPGFTIGLDGGVPMTLSESGVLADLEPGAHTLTLEAFPWNCTVAGPNPLSVSVISGQTVEAQFTLACRAAGTVIVIANTTTTNGARPESYGLTLDGQPAGPIAANGRTAIALVEGDHTAELTNLPATCGAENGTVDEFSISAADTTEILFEISCPPAPVAPAITLTVTTQGFFGGPFDTDGYDVLLDDVKVTHVGSNTTARLIPADPGPHSLALSGLAPGCSYGGEQQIVVPDSASVSVRFLVHCFFWPDVP
jgi:hypothetical protein